MSVAALLQLLLAYVLGSIPTAYIAGRRLKGLDIRRHGSGNVGATNVFRVLGKGPGAAVLLLDMAKGVLAVALIPRLAAPTGLAAFGGDIVLKAWWPCALGLAAVLGHSYTCFLGFKGGKGVATSAGVFLGLAPWATLCVLGIFLLVFAATRMVSAGSLAGALALPGLVAAFKEWRPAASHLGLAGLGGLFGLGWGPGERPVFWLACGLAALVWVKHIPNLQRIMAGTENRFGKDKEGKP